jgi:hypothetical protein
MFECDKWSTSGLFGNHVNDVRLSALSEGLRVELVLDNVVCG